MTKHFLLGISILPALLVMPAMAAAPNTTDTAFVFGDITAPAGAPIDNMAVGGRRISTDMVGDKYRNDFPNYSMIGRSLDIPANTNPSYPATTLYVGPVNLTLRELTDNDVFRYNYQYPVAYDEETGQYVAISDPDTDVDLADWAGIVWNDSHDDIIDKVGDKIGNENAGYTAPGVEMFSRRDNTKTAGSLSIAKTNATVDGTTVNANSISVTQGSTLTVANKATALLNTATRWYSVADQIASSGMTTLNAQTITVDGSTINLDHVVVKENNIPVGIRDAKLVINSETPTGITTIQNVASGYGALTVNGDGSLDLGGAELNFTNNTSTSHGAGLYYKDQSYGSGTQHGTNTAVLNATDITFSGNEVLADATSGSGAGVFLSGGKLSILGATNTFTDNHMNSTSIVSNRLYKTGGGAVANQSYDLESGQVGTKGDPVDADMIIGKADGSSVNMFTDNTSTTNGGAIMNRAEKTDGNATLTINGTTTFDNNSADINGGAIYNLARDGKEANLYMNNGTYTFTANSATEFGGAIYNEGTMQLANATFRNNIATAAGGAIYNAGTINLNGTNTFVGNTANGHANDIDSRGTLNIALGGTTTLSGGITGNGILNIADGATLNIGTASVAQNTINLNGTMLATLRGGDNAQITATSAFNGAGELKLAFDGEGLYHVFGGKVFAKENGIDLSSVVYDLTWSEDGKDVTASLKSVEDLAEENHLTTETAATIVNLTSSTSDVLNDLSVTIQEKLATGTEEARQEVEHAQVAINPEKESVVQSVTSSVQNAVSSLAMSRMSMPMGGRNGGDAKVTGRGVWVNGIFNKAKQNDAFNGYTRGFAAGLDGTINNKWTIGAGYSFAHSDVDGSARDTEIESSSVFVYGQYRRKAWYVNGVANYTMADYSEQGTALGMPVTADYDVKSYGANVATGYRFAGGITPELSLRYLHIDGSDYVNSLGIKNELKESDYLTASLGTKYAFRIKVTEAFRLRPELSYAVKYDMLSDEHAATVTMPGLNSYALNGDRLSRIAGEFGIGLGARYKGLDVSLNYDIEAREDYTSQSGRLKFRYNF